MSGTAKGGDRAGNDASRRERSDVQSQRDRVMGNDSRATTPIGPASKTGERVQETSKRADQPEQLQAEHAQATQQKAESQQAEQDEKLMHGANPQGVVPQKSDESQTRTVVGVVASASDQEVELKSSDALELKLRVDPSTSVRLDGQQGKASQIKPGNEVRASYKSVDGKLTALRLDVSSSKGSPSQGDPTK